MNNSTFTPLPSDIIQCPEFYPEWKLDEKMQPVLREENSTTWSIDLPDGFYFEADNPFELKAMMMEYINDMNDSIEEIEYLLANSTPFTKALSQNK